MVPFNLPLWHPTPHIANKRMQIAPTASASVATTASPCVQSFRAMVQGAARIRFQLELDQRP
jgi:hypothetical protein